MKAEAATNVASTSAEAEIDRQSREDKPRPSLNSLALMRRASSPTNISSVDINDWRLVVYQGVLLENNTQKFWVHEKLHKNCFLVLPKPFQIEWGKDKRYWKWIPVKESWPVEVLVPKLLMVSWLEIQGKFETNALSPHTKYEVAFVVKIGKSDYPWPLPVNLELDVPNRPKQIRTENLEKKPMEKWIKLRAGEFRMGPETVGTIVFTLHETCQIFKSGLIVGGVLVGPKD